MIRFVTGFLLIMALVACGGSNDVPFVKVADDDALMATAFKQAKENIHILDEHIGKDDIYCAIKVGFTHDQGTEYCWIGRVTKADGSTDEYQGRFDSAPKHSIGHKLGDTVRFKKERVVDWLVKTKSGPAQGNYTLKALLPTMTPEDAEGAKRAMGWE